MCEQVGCHAWVWKDVKSIFCVILKFKSKQTDIVCESVITEYTDNQFCLFWIQGSGRESGMESRTDLVRISVRILVPTFDSYRRFITILAKTDLVRIWYGYPYGFGTDLVRNLVRIWYGFWYGFWYQLLILTGVL